MKISGINRIQSFDAKVVINKEAQELLAQKCMTDAKRGFDSFVRYAATRLNQDPASVLYINAERSYDPVVKLSTINQDGIYLSCPWTIHSYDSSNTILDNLIKTVKVCFNHLTRDNNGRTIA